jgi:sulfane dehydrogenase subunit SoxC
VTGSALEPTAGPLTFEELALATRNRGMPLEALAYDITPTGLHYLLIHFDIPVIDAASWRLDVQGAVGRRLSLSLADLRAMPRVEHTVTMECAGNGRARLHPRPMSQPWLHEAIGTAVWAGTPLAGVLAHAGLDGDAVDVVFTGADRGIQGGIEHNYARALSVAEATGGDALLAYEMNGEPLQPQHGSPLRLVVPGWYGMTSVKWLSAIDVLTTPFDGYQQVSAYRYQREPDDTGEPVTRMRARALMVPPGIPDFFSRSRVVDAGVVELRGRAWCGLAPLRAVEVCIDGQWLEAKLDEPVGPYAWRGWRASWTATLGEHTLACRAIDDAGGVQPSEEPWNYQGMGNNQMQEISVTVR